MKEILYSQRFVDKPPYEVFATLLDEGRYLCSIRTMYRILGEDQVREDGEISFGIRTTRSRSCSRPRRIKSGRGTSPSCWDRRNGRITTCT